MTDSNEAIYQAQECALIRVLPDGSLLLQIGDKEQEVQVYGIEIHKPPPQEYFDWFDQRLRRIRRPLRCLVRGFSEADKVTAQLFYFGWQDKSGDVWLDLAPVLLREGFARVASGDFPEREQYLRYEKARPR